MSNRTLEYITTTLAVLACAGWIIARGVLK